jgi:hypothetical protein
MSTKETNALRARVDGTAMNFFRAHKELAPVDANAAMLEEWIDSKLLDAGNPENWEIAYLAIGGQLAKASRQAPSPIVVDEPVPNAQVVDGVPDGSWSKERLRDYLAVHKTPTGERRLGSRDERREAMVLPAQYTRQLLASRSFSKAQMDNLFDTYGREAVRNRIDGRS